MIAFEVGIIFPIWKANGQKSYIPYPDHSASELGFRLASLITNPSLETRNVIGKQQREARGPVTLLGVRAVDWSHMVHMGCWCTWQRGLKVHTGRAAWDRAGLLWRAPLARHGEQIPKAWFCLSAFLVSAHATFLLESGGKPALLSTIKFLPLPRNSQPDWACFLCCFSESFCAPPPRASFPLFPSVRLNSLMVIIIISICCCSQLPLDLQTLV